jgi:hypothetical protein
MAANKQFTHVVALSSTLTTNILTPGTTTGGTPSQTGSLYILIKHIRVVNKHASIAATYSLYQGATGANAAGTEIMGFGRAVAVGGYDEWFPPNLRLDAAVAGTAFLVGGSNTATALTIQIVGEIGIS